MTEHTTALLVEYLRNLAGFGMPVKVATTTLVAAADRLEEQARDIHDKTIVIRVLQTKIAKLEDPNGGRT